VTKQAPSKQQWLFQVLQLPLKKRGSSPKRQCLSKEDPPFSAKKTQKYRERERNPGERDLNEMRIRVMNWGLS